VTYMSPLHCVMNL